MRSRGAAPARQRGWAGALMLLLALFAVMILAVVALRQYVLPPASAPPGVASGGAPSVPAGESAAAQSPIERARGLQGTVHEQAADMQKRIDAVDK